MTSTTSARVRRYQQPWLHDLLVAVDGNATLLTDALGMVTSQGALGFFVDDSRCLSLLDVQLGGEPARPLTAAAGGNAIEVLSSARHLGDSGTDPTVELSERLMVHGPVLDVELVIRSRSDADLDADLVIRADGDGMGIADVKTGLPPATPLVAMPTSAGAQWSSTRHRVRLSAHPDPADTTITDQGVVELRFPLHVDAHEQATVTLEVRADRLGGSLFDTDPGSDLLDWSGLRIRAADPRLSTAVTHAVADLRHLLLTDPQAPEDVFAAAGTPWYLTLFGRDSLWTARMALPLGTDLARGTLRALARRQGTVTDATRAEEPGKILHEVRRTAGEGAFLPPLYYGTVDATSLWIVLLHDAWRWGMAEPDVTELLPALRAAAGYLIRAAAQDADGLLRYVDKTGQGLANQGWKDSWDSIRWQDGTVAQGPIALIEAQAYAVEAAVDAATILEELGQPDDRPLAGQLRTWAGALTQRIRDRYWVHRDGHDFLAMALDGAGQPVDGLASNMGHALGTGVLNPSESSAVVARLMDPRLLGRFGIRTLSTDNAGFNPIGYHTGSAWTHDTAICALGMLRAGFTAQSGEVARRLLDAAEQFDYCCPELFADEGVLDRPAPYPASCHPQAWAAASMVALCTIALGLDVDVPRRIVRVMPPRPAPFGAIQVSGLRFGPHRVDVAVDEDGHVLVRGLPADFDVRTER